jgi:hypothetical protein
VKTPAHEVGSFRWALPSCRATSPCSRFAALIDEIDAFIDPLVPLLGAASSGQQR